jgi:type II secretory pathway pseudopilin PulG
MKTRHSRGFTLIEALVSVLILTVVMIVALTLLVSMRSFASKQQAFTAPRQSARSAIDYLSFFLAGATDLNVLAGNPNALIMWTTNGVAATPRQASFNNLTALEAAAGYGGEGTDIISVAIATNPIRIPIVVPAGAPWTGNSPSGDTAVLDFSAGCGAALGPDVVNLNLFKQVTGATTVGGTDVSGLLTVSDGAGRWRYIRITQYVSSECVEMTGPDPSREVITIKFIRGDADQVNPPGGWRNDLVEPLTLNAGFEYTSFRARNGALEQKTTGFDAAGVYSPGIFNPDCDGTTQVGICPSIGFTPVVENVEDLQVAYVFRDGTIWNSLGNPATKPGAIPAQLATGTGVPGATDISFVRALRVSVIARSNPLDIGARQLSAGPPPTPTPGPTPVAGEADTRRIGLYRRPALEDHAEGQMDTVATGVFDRYRLTTTLILRNRLLGF